jgi:prefoldin beta subunit
MAITQQQAQQLLMQAQVYQQQMQNIMTQKEALRVQEMEIKKAAEELEKSKESSVYRVSGTILIKASRQEVSKDLKDKQETIGLRMATLEKSENSIRDRIEDIRKKLGEDPEESPPAKGGG